MLEAMLIGQLLRISMFVYLSSLFLLGLLIGSFVSALTYRIPRGLGFVQGRSFCDSCKKTLFWYDNIPLFFYLFYRGASRCCGKKISIRYPIIELASSLGLVLIWILTNNYIYLVLYLITLSIFIIDLEHQIIPDELSWIILFLGLILNFSFLNIFAGFLFALVLLFIHLVTLGNGMGLGDVKLAISLGVWLGFSLGLTWLMLSFLTGGVVATILLITGKAKLKTKIAFGPFLIFAFWIAVLLIK